MNSRTDPTHDTHHSNLGSTAVDGLIAGAGAGVPMIAYLLITAGESPADLLNRFTGVGMQPSPVTGVVAHLAVCAIYGMVFVIFWRSLRWRPTLLWHVTGGIVFSLVLFIAAEYVLLPSLQSPLLAIPALHFGVAHVLYGLMLGYLYHSIGHIHLKEGQS